MRMALAMEEISRPRKIIFDVNIGQCAIDTRHDLRYDQNIEINYIASPDRALEEQFFVILTFDKSE